MPLYIGKSQKAALSQGFFNSLGGSKSQLGELPLNAVEEVLFRWGGELVKDMQNRLDRTDAVSSGTLSESIKLNVKAFGGTYELTVSLADYFDFVNKGVKGTQSAEKAPNSPYQFRYNGVSKNMLSALLGWVKREGLKSRIIKERRVTESVFKRKPKVIREKVRDEVLLANRIGVSIKKRGLRATNFFTGAIEDKYPQLAQELAKALGKDVAEVFRRIDDVTNKK